MAIPKNRKSISTNLPFLRLNTVLDALEEERVQFVAGKTSMYAEYAKGEFDFEGARYSVDEFVEEVTFVRLVGGDPAFIQTIIDELEAELSVVVNKRDYNEAKNINDKIEELKKIPEVGPHRLLFKKRLFYFILRINCRGWRATCYNTKIMKIFIKAKPNSKENRVEKVDDSNFVVSIKDPPVQGRANLAIIRELAEYFGVSPSRVRIIFGHTARQKVVEIL